MLHNKFIVFPIAKTGVNIALVCQKHYAQVLINKLGLNHVNPLIHNVQNWSHRL